ncbi:MAG TPA: hypothetical protein PKC85_01755 [Bacteroidia bacterium]|nr:hypothetical protein [Bacteroidia bacterium]HMU18542.1 hypothetical protein [Bacteroidia bacterium]
MKKQHITFNGSGLLLAFAGTVFLMSCNNLPVDFKKDKNKNAIARVYDKYLYSHDIKDLVPKDATPQDSSMIVKSFIDDWIKQNIVLHQAENNLLEEHKNVERQLQEYRNSLITFAYEQELVRQRLDTTVTEQEIEQYYNNNKQNFLLKNNIVKATFIKAAKKTPKIDKLKTWFNSSKEKDRQLLEEFCFQYAIDYSLNDNDWMQFDDLLKRVPIKTYDKEEFLRNNRNIETADSVNIYLIKITDFKTNESVSPLDFVKDNIKNLIINKRKLALIEQMQKSAFEQALKNNDFEIYK